VLRKHEEMLDTFKKGARGAKDDKLQEFFKNKMSTIEDGLKQAKDLDRKFKDKD
jgi:hypothetical protein